MSTLSEEISRRRTFAIISHPDAGKTTLTEKFLLYGGAIAQAGVVKGKKKPPGRHVRLDGDRKAERHFRHLLCDAVSVRRLLHQHSGYPGHQDFSEDTYRTLMAADSAVMVIDGSKGVEAQTRKLFKVCAMRHIPIFTFVNKMDREAKDPFDLLEELEQELGIETYAMNWPIGSGKEFQGVYDRQGSQLLFFSSGSAERTRRASRKLTSTIPRCPPFWVRASTGSSLTKWSCWGAGRDFDLEEVRAGKLSPVFFGSALTNFGVEPFLEEFLRLTPPPRLPGIGQRVGGRLFPGLFRLRLQDPGQHEQGPPGPAGFPADLLRQIPAGGRGFPRPG